MKQSAKKTYAAEEFDEIEDRLIVDLGAGGGALTAAAIYVNLTNFLAFFAEHDSRRAPEK